MISQIQKIQILIKDMKMKDSAGANIETIEALREELPHQFVLTVSDSDGTMIKTSGQ